jgi:hypothetical protein
MILGCMVDVALDKKLRTMVMTEMRRITRRNLLVLAPVMELILHLKSCMIIPTMMMT